MPPMAPLIETRRGDVLEHHVNDLDRYVAIVRGRVPATGRAK
jgi:hypothetical protein